MNIRPHFPDRQSRSSRDDEAVSKTVTPLATLPVGRERQLHLSAVRSVRAVSVQMRTFVADGRGSFRPAGPPLYVFGEQIPDLIAALSALDLTVEPA